MTRLRSDNYGEGKKEKLMKPNECFFHKNNSFSFVSMWKIIMQYWHSCFFFFHSFPDGVSTSNNKNNNERLFRQKGEKQISEQLRRKPLHILQKRTNVYYIFADKWLERKFQCWKELFPSNIIFMRQKQLWAEHLFITFDDFNYFH